ncbi:MAG: transglutaminase domain-containing protein [Aggregatilineales bacterium]
MRYSTRRPRRFEWIVMWRRLRNSLRMLFTRGDFSALIIACAIMVLPVLSMSQTLSFGAEFAVQSGNWAVSLDQIVPVVILSVVFGFLLARSQYSELTSLILSGLYSLGAVLVVQFFAASGDAIERVYAVVARFVSTLQGGFTESIGFDPFLLIVVLSVLFWFLGHNAAWHLFRLDRVWRAILPPGIVLVLNSVYNTDPGSNQDGYVILFIFLALLLLIRSHIDAREYDWYISRLAFRSSVRRWFFRLGSLAGAAALLLAWALPTGNAQENARRLRDFLNEESLARLMDIANRLFGSLEGQGPVTANYFGGDQLWLGGPINLGDQIVMAVDAPPGLRYYWKSSTFDTYQGGRWTTTASAEQQVGAGGITLSHFPVQAGTRREVTQRFVITMGGSRLVYAAPQLKSIRLPVRVQLNFIDRGSGLSDPLTFWAGEPLLRGAQYSVVSSVSVASAEFLRQTSTQYPSWVTSKYLQVPPEITQRTRELAQQIVRAANAQTAYDKTKAIETWLRQNIAYSNSLGNPPAGRDPVDWMLFERREAYCTYYASAMIMMLRSQGVPARMAAGFSQGVYDPENQYFVVRERDAHTWVEVYFNGAGWVEFEPTAAQSVINRTEIEQLPPTPTPAPTATPTPLPTPTPTPTQPSGNVAEPLQLPPLLSATPSPTPSPTPTPTPTLRPLLPLELPPPVTDFLSNLLVVAMLIALLSFGSVTALWWAEYRGLDRLSPIGRAYARLERAAQRLGVSLKASDTALERGKRAARALREEGQPIMTITDAYITERYAPRPPDIAEEKQVESAWRRVRRALLGRWLRGKGKAIPTDE